MKPGMDRAKREIEELLESDELTAGMFIRVHGDHLILARRETEPRGGTVAGDRVRLTRLGQSAWGLSVKRHTGRWERTPFSGNMREVMDAVWTFMQHLVAPH